MIILFKLLITPLFIGSATLIGRRWGPIVNGLVVGLPLTTGPISFILANQYGLEFATKAAAGNLAGQVSMCVFCLTYSLAAPRTGWKTSVLVSTVAFLMTTAALNSVVWQLLPAFSALLIAIVLVVGSVPQHSLAVIVSAPPKWDLPARIIVATTFVLILTTVANALGPQLSGLISTFPIFGLVFAAFTHAQRGPQAVSNLLRGIVLGSVSYAFFFLTVGLGLIPLGIVATYALALLATLVVSGFFYYLTQNRQRSPAPG